MNVEVLLDGQAVLSGSDSAGGMGPRTIKLVPQIGTDSDEILEPGTSTPRTPTARVYDRCAGEVNVTIDEVNVTVIGFG